MSLVMYEGGLGGSWPPADPDDVENLATMLRAYLGPSAEDVPQERLLGLAEEIATHFGEESYDVAERMDVWIGEYLD